MSLNWKISTRMSSSLNRCSIMGGIVSRNRSWTQASIYGLLSRSIRRPGMRTSDSLGQEVGMGKSTDYFKTTSECDPCGLGPEFDACRAVEGQGHRSHIYHITDSMYSTHRQS